MPEPTVKKYIFRSVEDLNDAAGKQAAKAEQLCKKAPLQTILNSLEKLYAEALKQQKENNLEASYLLFNKLLVMWTYCRKNKADYDEKYVIGMIGKEINIAVKQCEDIIPKLDKIYTKLNAHKKIEPPDKFVDSATIPKLPQPSAEKNGHRSNSLNGVGIIREERISITCQELFETALKNGNSAFLIIDVRLKEDYLFSRIQIQSVDLINVSEDLIGQFLIPSKLETTLQEEFRDMFKRRGDYGQVVLMDWFSTKSSFTVDTSSPIYMMTSKLKKYDPRIKYKNKPVILEGGYEEWLSRYPSYTTNSNVSPPKKKINDHRISIDHINYPTNALLEPEKIENKPMTPELPQNTSNKPDTDTSVKVKSNLPSQENSSKPTFDRSTKPSVSTVENGISAPPSEKNPQPITKDETPANEKQRVESFEEDEEELKNKCVKNGRRPALTSLSNQPLSINNNNIVTTTTSGSIVDSDEDLDASYRDEEKENRMNTMKNARLNVHDETSSNLKRYSSTPNISKLENEYSKPTIDRSTKPSNDDQINIFTKTAMYTDEEGRGLTGLLNVGNTCYMNSILQCLSNTEHLRKIMCLLPYNFTNPKSKTEGLIAREVSNIIKQLWMKDNSPVSCRTLKNIVGKHRDSFRGSEQQDSHEFLTILIDWLHEDLNEPMPDRCLKGADEKSGEKAWGEFISKNNSKIRQLFYGQQKSTVSCNTCEKESVTFEPFSNLSLPLPSAEKCTLAECLKLYTSNEHITGWQCPACKSPRAATKKLDITKLPPLLVIHFKRFTSDGYCRKRLTDVNFPNLLDMTPYLIGHEHRNRRYELYAVSNHMGSMETGHYTAFCRNSVNGRWYKFDDDNVSHISNLSKAASAYIVFYQCLLNN